MEVEGFHAQAKDRYWKHKDLPSARSLLEKGIALAQSQGRPDLEKPLQYDLASFCWPGWNEPGIAIRASDLEAGERAADENLRLALELKRGYRPLANAFFMVGAYHLARGRLEEAKDAFSDQGKCANLAHDTAGGALATGYAELAEGLGRGNLALGPTLERLRSSGWEHGAEFADQLETAARVFSR